jgi:hypothetical protein
MTSEIVATHEPLKIYLDSPLPIRSSFLIEGEYVHLVPCRLTNRDVLFDVHSFHYFGREGDVWVRITVCCAYLIRFYLEVQCGLIILLLLFRNLSRSWSHHERHKLGARDSYHVTETLSLTIRDRSHTECLANPHNYDTEISLMLQSPLMPPQYDINRPLSIVHLPLTRQVSCALSFNQILSD